MRTRTDDLEELARAVGRIVSEVYYDDDTGATISNDSWKLLLAAYERLIADAGT